MFGIKFSVYRSILVTNSDMDGFSGPSQLQNLQSGEVTSCDLNVNYFLAIGSSDKNVRVLEWKCGLGFVDMFYSPLSYHKYAVTWVRFSPKGTMLASSSLDGTAVLTDVLTGTKIFTMVQYNTSDIRYCEFTFDCTKLITAGVDGLLCFWDLAQHREIRHHRLHEVDYSLKAMTVSPDSEYLLSIDSGNLLKLWLISNIINDQPCCLLNKKEDDVLCCDFSPIKKITGTSSTLEFNYCIVTSSTEKLLKIREVKITKDPNHEEYVECDLILLRSLKLESDILSVRFSFCGKYLVGTGLDNLVKLWEVKDGIRLKILRGHKRLATCAAFSKDSLLLVTGSIDKTFIIWDLSQNLTLDYKLLIPCNLSCHFTHINVTNYPSGDIRDQTKKYNEFSLLQKLTFSSSINSVQFQGNNILAVAGRDKTVGIWEKQTDKIIYKQKEILKEHEYSINNLDMLSCGTKIISCSMDGIMIYWDLNMDLTYKMKIPSSIGSLRTCKFSPDSKFIAAAGDDQKVYLWDANNLEFLKTMQHHENAITAVAFTPDGKFLVSTCCEGDLMLQNLQEDSAATIKNAHDLGVTCCDFSSITTSECLNLHSNPSGRENSGIYLLATGGKDSLVKLWNVGISEILILKVLSGHGGTVNCIKFSPTDPFILASCSSDTTVRIWDAKAKRCLHVLNHHTSPVTTCSFSKNSVLLATGSLDKSVSILGVIEKFCHDPTEPIENFNKLLENWTTSDLANWFLDIDCPGIADKIRTKQINGRKLLSFSDTSLTDFFGLINETEKGKLRRKVLILKKSLSFPSEILQKSANVSHKFLCPITHYVMKDPVICADGYVYDREAINEWFLGGKLISPITKERLATTRLLPHSQLKKLIYKFLFENENEFSEKIEVFKS